MIIVMGLPGAGKSTVLAAAKNTGYIMKNYGDLMYEIASKQGHVKHRDELRKMDTATQKKVQSAVGDELSKMTGKVILDTHCSIQTPNGYLPGLPYSLLSKLTVDKLVLINAPAEEILARRKADTTRVRETNIEEIREHDNVNISFLAAYSALTGAPAVIISNRQGKLEEAQQKFLSLLK
ncbi:MAG: adenylate kinase [Candidatus Micrarchaeota archaeon]|nr:adenylate kinase [Candidatus Micrarchaeota archaeon]